MILRNLKVINTNDVIDIHLEGKNIARTSRTPIVGEGSPSLSFENAVVLPGLINSHDHLDFNLFPQLGGRNYYNYTEWAHYIHTNFKDEIASVLKVPETLRIQWGIYKNLVGGVTTVVNHAKTIADLNYPVSVVQNYQILHSPGFEKYLMLRLNNPLKVNTPAVIHVGEGTDELAAKEIDKLIKWNLLRRKLIGIHGVAMNIEQAKMFTALVWCPASNYFLFNKTAKINALKHSTAICFGTDSTLTSTWNIWEHIRLAHRASGVTSKELIDMLTLNPAQIWKTNGGKIAAGYDADMIVVRASPDPLFQTNPEDILLVINKGEICLFDHSLHDELTAKVTVKNNFSCIAVGKGIKYVKGNIPGLIARLQHYLPNVKLPFTPVPAPSFVHD